MELKINWPEGATHFCPAFGRYSTRCYKLEGDKWFRWTGFDWFEQRFPPVQSVMRHMILRDTPARLERARSCDRMFGVLLKLPEGANRSDMVEALYDAGYRLPEPPADEAKPCEQ